MALELMSVTKPPKWLESSLHHASMGMAIVLMIGMTGGKLMECCAETQQIVAGLPHNCTAKIMRTKRIYTIRSM